jgi:hypothetical protein
MLDAIGAPAILEAGREAIKQADAAVGFPEQQAATVRGDAASVETCGYPALEVVVKFEAGLTALCHSEGRFLFGVNC